MPRSTTSFLFPDINIWIALTLDRHVHHARATRWFESLGGSRRLFFCRFTQLGLLRLLTAEAVMGPGGAVAQTEAWRIYDRWLQDERVSFLTEPPEMDPAFRTLTQSAQAAPKDWADSYLVAFARTAQLILVTMDRGIAAKTSQVVFLDA